MVTKLRIDTPERNHDEKERRYSWHDTSNEIVLIKERKYFFMLGTPNEIVDDMSRWTKIPWLIPVSIQPESSFLKTNLILWLIPRLDLFWKFNFENKFDTLAYPEAQFILKAHSWKINSIPWLISRLDSFWSILKINSIPCLIPGLDSFFMFIWK